MEEGIQGGRQEMYLLALVRSEAILSLLHVSLGIEVNDRLLVVYA